MDRFDTIIIGAGAAGMFCALEAGRRRRRVLLLEHNKAPGEKIRISGGGRCNFTNLNARPDAYLSENPKFAISALSRFTPEDFLDRLRQRGIAWHEKTLGQLFCDGSARQIVDLLVDGMAECGVQMRLQTSVEKIARTASGFAVSLPGGVVQASSLVIATGGKSIPRMGAGGFGYRVAAQFQLPLITPRPGLVPLVFAGHDLGRIKPLAGLSLPASVNCNGAVFAEGLLFTHRGLSGPSILQASSYWQKGGNIVIDLLPGTDAARFLREARAKNGRQHPATALSGRLARRLAAMVCNRVGDDRPLADLSLADIGCLAGALNRWSLKPVATEGFRTAEVTLGGVSTAALYSRTMEVRAVPGLYFIGEVVDMTGWLGGYNFQWAWSSGWAAGQVV